MDQGTQAIALLLAVNLDAAARALVRSGPAGQPAPAVAQPLPAAGVNSQRAPQRNSAVQATPSLEQQLRAAQQEIRDLKSAADREKQRGDALAIELEGERRGHQEEQRRLEARIQDVGQQALGESAEALARAASVRAAAAADRAAIGDLRVAVAADLKAMVELRAAVAADRAAMAADRRATEDLRAEVAADRAAMAADRRATEDLRAAMAQSATVVPPATRAAATGATATGATATGG
jgi:hypothetical protein